ncbi:hypothetical protein Tco_1512723 [Tanacetum coccineum]
MASGGSNRDAKDELSKLLQMGTVDEYHNDFEMLINRVTGISESLLTTIYISGLKVALQIELLRARPTTLVEAFSLARIIEARFEAIAHEEKATTEKEQSIKETADTIASLQSDVASLKTKRSLDANEEIKKDHTVVHDLEMQVEKLPMELQLKNNFMEALETTSKDLEKTMLDLNPTLHDLQKVSVDKKKKCIGCSGRRWDYALLGASVFSLFNLGFGYFAHKRIWDPGIKKFFLGITLRTRWM